MVNPKLPVHSVADYVRFAKASPDGVTFASSGSGSSIHLSGEMFKMQAHLNMLHVPYRGSAPPAVSDLLGGQVQSMFDNTPSSLPHVKAGRLRAIAITSAQRFAATAGGPNRGRVGLPGFRRAVAVSAWPRPPAPRAVIDKLNAVLNKTLGAPDVRQRLQGHSRHAGAGHAGTGARLRRRRDQALARGGQAVRRQGGLVH